MLVWEEEVKPSTPHIASRAQGQASSGHSEHQPSIAPVPASNAVVNHAPRAAALAKAPVAEAGTRRVNAADKRIINGKTDVNQLVPFKYK